MERMENVFIDSSVLVRQPDRDRDRESALSERLVLFRLFFFFFSFSLLFHCFDFSDSIL